MWLNRFVTRTHFNSAWSVRLVYGNFDSGITVFGDLEYKGADNALVAAIDYCKALVQKERIPVWELEANVSATRCRNKLCNEIGVSLTRDSPELPYRVNWSGRVVQNGKPRNLCRSVSKYGYIGAWREIVSLRIQPFDTLEIPPVPPGWLYGWVRRLQIELEHRNTSLDSVFRMAEMAGPEYITCLPDYFRQDAMMRELEARKDDAREMQPWTPEYEFAEMLARLRAGDVSGLLAHDLADPDRNIMRLARKGWDENQIHAGLQTLFAATHPQFAAQDSDIIAQAVGAGLAARANQPWSV